MGYIETRRTPGGVRYRVRYRVGAATLSQTCATKAEAKRFLAGVETDLARGTWIDPRGGDVTVAAWVAEWQATRGTVKPSTAAADDGRLRTHLLPAFGTLRLADVSPSLVRRWVSDLYRRRAPKTVRHCHGLLHSVLQSAVEEGLIRRNPCVGTRLPEVVRREHVRLNELELERLLICVDPHYRPLVETLAGTGMRWGEALGLLVRRVDLLSRPPRLTVAQSRSEISGRITYGTPKTAKSWRVVSLPDRVVEALLPLVAGRDGDELVFVTVEGAPIRYSHFRTRVWKPAVARAGLERTPPLRIHDLRHTHVALLIAAGIPLSAIRDRLGHENISVTDGTYGYLLKRVDDQVLGALNAVFASSPDATSGTSAPISLPSA